MNRVVIAPIVAVLSMIAQLIFHVQIPDDVQAQIVTALIGLVSAGYTVYGVVKKKQVTEEIKIESIPYTNPHFSVVSIQSATPPELPYGVQMIGAPLEWPETKGAGIKVAIIDTGSPNHPDIKVTKAIDFGGSGDPNDKNGHGTHVAGIIAGNGKIKGVSPEVELYCLKVDTGNGLSTQAIANALQWCAQNKIDVVNMSLGGPTPDSSIEQACKACYDAGIVLVTAAGNWGRDFGVLYPAKYPTTVATAAVDIDKLPGLLSEKSWMLPPRESRYGQPG
jgi:subtilisin family serine protease